MRTVLCFLCFCFVAASLPEWEADVVDQHLGSSFGNISFLILDIRLVVRRLDQETDAAGVPYHVYDDMVTGFFIFFSFFFFFPDGTSSRY